MLRWLRFLLAGVVAAPTVPFHTVATERSTSSRRESLTIRGGRRWRYHVVRVPRGMQRASFVRERRVRSC